MIKKTFNSIDLAVQTIILIVGSFVVILPILGGNFDGVAMSIAFVALIIGGWQLLNSLITTFARFPLISLG